MEKQRKTRVNLLTFVRPGDAEVNPAFVVDSRGCRDVQFRQRNLFGVLRGEYPHRLADDGIILDLLLVLIAENQHRRHNGIGAPRLTRRRRRRRRRRVSIPILIALLAHSLFVQALLVHLIRQTSLFILILIVGRTIPPPVGIDSAAEVGITVAPTAAVAVTIVSEAVAAESKTVEAVEAAGAESTGSERRTERRGPAGREATRCETTRPKA